MAKITAKDPGTVLKSFLDEYQLNPSQLGKEVELSQSTIRQITLNKMKISIPIALRFAKFFGNTEKFWIDLQTTYSLTEAADDKELNDVLNKINKAVKPSPVKKAAQSDAPKTRARKAPAAKEEKPPKSSAPTAKETTRKPRGRKAK